MNFVQVIWDAIRSFWDLLVYIVSGIGFNDILDIIVITYLIYKCIGFFRQSRAGQLMKGIGALLIAALIANWLEMVMVNWLMVRIVDSALVAAVIIFQPEIRRALEQVGTSRLGLFGRGSTANLEEQELEYMIEVASRAAGTMQEQKCGALMVFERATQLGEIIATGTSIEAKSTTSLICNIFFPKSPLHDGAMILRAGRVQAAGCILPLTQNSELNQSLGTRHRAAIGMSENSDAVVVVVSEETGTISVAINGELRRGFNAVTLRTELNELLLEHKDKASGGHIRRMMQRMRQWFGKRNTGDAEQEKGEK